MGGASGQSTELAEYANSRSIWYRESPSSFKTGPFSLDVVSRWYDNCAVLPSAEFSSDDGEIWISIVDLRRRNGISCPFLSLLHDYEPSGSNIDELIEAEEATIARLEKEVELMMSDLRGDEDRLQKMGIIEKKMEGNSQTSEDEVEEEGFSKEIGPESLKPCSSASSDDKCVIDKSSNKFWENALAKANEFHPSREGENGETTQQVVGPPLYQMPPPPQFIHHSLQPPPFMTNVLLGIPLPLDALFLNDLVNRTAAVNVLRVDQNGRAHAINGVDPMSILQCVPAPPNLAIVMVTPYAIKLLELLKTCNKDRFKALVNHQFSNGPKPRCMACGTVESRVPALLLKHVVSPGHVDKMKARKLLFCIEALAYWMQTLRIAQMKQSPKSFYYCA